jgi:hypothetical protein
MPRQSSIQLTDATDSQVAQLQERGFGTFTDIVRIAIDRMHRQEMPPAARRHIICNPRHRSIYGEVEHVFGDDYRLVDIVESDKSGRGGKIKPGHVIVGSTSAHPNSGPWFVITAPSELAEEILDRVNSR